MPGISQHVRNEFGRKSIDAASVPSLDSSLAKIAQDEIAKSSTGKITQATLTSAIEDRLDKFFEASLSAGTYANDPETLAIVQNFGSSLASLAEALSSGSSAAAGIVRKSLTPSEDYSITSYDSAYTSSGRPASPAPRFAVSNGRTRQAQSGEFMKKSRLMVVSGLGAAGVMKLRASWTVSWHVGRTDDPSSYDRARQNAADYASSNEAAVWYRATDLGNATPENFQQGAVDQSTPRGRELTGEQPLGNGAILASKIKCPENPSGKPHTHHFGAAVDVEVPMEQGKVYSVMVDPAAGQSAGVGGYQDRRIDFVWDGT